MLGAIRPYSMFVDEFTVEVGGLYQCTKIFTKLALRVVDLGVVPVCSNYHKNSSSDWGYYC